MAVSQKSIAEKLGVSIALVSRVLSGKAAEIGIAPATIARVTEEAERAGYVPNVAALSLKGKATRSIGVAVYDFNDPFFGSLIKKIQIQAHEYNHSLILAGFLSRVPDQKDLQSLHKHAIDGLIILGSDSDAPWLSDFKHLPIARIGHGAPAEKSVRVTIDESQAAEQILQHLIQQNRTNAIYVSSPLSVHQHRQAAFKKTAEQLGLQLPTILASNTAPIAAGREAVQQLLQEKRTIDALICATDQIAIGALHALHEAGISSPETIAVTGFDGITAAEHFIPAITTIQQPIKAIVQQAFAAILTPTEPKEILLQGHLIPRQTT